MISHLLGSQPRALPIKLQLPLVVEVGIAPTHPEDNSFTDCGAHYTAQLDQEFFKTVILFSDGIAEKICFTWDLSDDPHTWHHRVLCL